MTTTDKRSMKLIQDRQISALLNPRPVVLVTCCDEHNVPNVLSVAWQTPLSHNPPLVGISIDSHHYSHELIVKTGEFVINIVPQEFKSAIEFCGNQSGRDLDKFAAAGIVIQPAHCVHPPLIQGALGHIECAVENSIPTGDHTFFVGRVLYAEADSASFNNSWQPDQGDVILCVQRDQFGKWSLCEF